MADRPYMPIYCIFNIFQLLLEQLMWELVLNFQSYYDSTKKKLLSFIEKN